MTFSIKCKNGWQTANYRKKVYIFENIMSFRKCGKFWEKRTLFDEQMKISIKCEK